MKKRTVLHLFAGLGGGGLGFKLEGFEGVGAYDIDPATCRDYETIVGEPATCADLAVLTVAELRRRVGPRRPDVVFLSPPCKGFSFLLSEERSKEQHYQDLNALAHRGIFLVLSAWPDDPPPIIIMENVPRILARGKEMLSEVERDLQAHEYSVALSVHDCGEIGGLAQHRKRFMLVARHMPSVPGFLRVPPTQRVRGLGEVLGSLPVPLPGSSAGGPMHRLPKMIPKNWIRLALIPAGADWRSLPASVRLPPRAARQNGQYGVEGWDAPGHAVVGHSSAREAFASIADPRLVCVPKHVGHYGVQDYGAPSKTIRGDFRVTNSPASVADPRLGHKERRGCRGVQDWSQPSATIRGHHNVNNSPASVGDPRLTCKPRRGAYGVQGWATPSHAILGHHCHDNAPGSVADPRMPEIAGPPLEFESKKATHMVIRALDGTWHRPMTTLENAAIQGLPVFDESTGKWLELDGNDHAGWRMRIGNAVPVQAAQAIARACIEALDAADEGKWTLGGGAIWTRHHALAA